MKKLNSNIIVFYNFNSITITNAKLWFVDMINKTVGVKLSDNRPKHFFSRNHLFDINNQINSVEITFRNIYQMQEFIKENLLNDSDFTITEYLPKALIKE